MPPKLTNLPRPVGRYRKGKGVQQQESDSDDDDNNEQVGAQQQQQQQQGDDDDDEEITSFGGAAVAAGAGATKMNIALRQRDSVKTTSQQAQATQDESSEYGQLFFFATLALVCLFPGLTSYLLHRD